MNDELFDPDEIDISLDDPDFHEEHGYFKLDSPIKCLWCGLKSEIVELDRNGYNCKVLIPHGMIMTTVWKGPGRSITFDEQEWQTLCEIRKKEHDKRIMAFIMAQCNKKERKIKKEKRKTIVVR